LNPALPTLVFARLDPTYIPAGLRDLGVPLEAALAAYRDGSARSALAQLPKHDHEEAITYLDWLYSRCLSASEAMTLDELLLL
jgi:hypothetical protein